MASSHQKNLENLCRICSEKLQKSKGAVTSKFQCLKWKEFLAEKFSIFVEKDLEEIHPQYFCHACYAHPDRRSVVPVAWMTHYDDDCRVCSCAEEIKKGGRPKKVRRGRKPELSDSCRTLQTPSSTLQDLDLLTKDMPSIRFAKFSEKFVIPENLKKELLCLQILEEPVETTCQHYFCVECMKGVIDSGQRGSCPVCKENIGSLKVPTRMVLRLIAEQEVICATCRKSVAYENSAVHVCEGAGQAPAVIPQPQQPAAVVAPDPAQAMRQSLEDAQAGKFSPEVEKICTAYVKARLKESTDGKTVPFKTGGKVRFLFTFNFNCLPPFPPPPSSPHTHPLRNLP